MEMMSMKPAKGRTLFTGVLGRASGTGLRKCGALLFEMTVAGLDQRWLSQNQKSEVKSWGWGDFYRILGR